VAKKNEEVEGEVEVDELTVMRRVDNLLKTVTDQRARGRVLHWLSTKWMPEESDEP